MFMSDWTPYSYISRYFCTEIVEQSAVVSKSQFRPFSHMIDLFFIHLCTSTLYLIDCADTFQAKFSTFIIVFNFTQLSDAKQGKTRRTPP